MSVASIPWPLPGPRYPTCRGEVQESRAATVMMTLMIMIVMTLIVMTVMLMTVMLMTVMTVISRR